MKKFKHISSVTPCIFVVYKYIALWKFFLSCDNELFYAATCILCSHMTCALFMIWFIGNRPVGRICQYNAMPLNSTAPALLLSILRDDILKKIWYLLCLVIFICIPFAPPPCLNPLNCPVSIPHLEGKRSGPTFSDLWPMDDCRSFENKERTEKILSSSRAFYSLFNSIKNHQVASPCF